ncbi:MAG TPA: hypothetical protein VF950_02235 [Planctomycetota bacterium]
MSKSTLAIAALLALGLAAAAERVVVANLNGASVDFFDSVTGANEGRVVVGSSPVDVAPDSASGFGPSRVFVANSGSNTVSVVQLDPAGVAATITGGGSYGTFQTPSGVALHPSGAMVVVDQKPSTYPGTPNGRSTIRFFHAGTFSLIDDYRDASATARYNDVVVTSNGKLWIADDGDQGVVVARFPASLPPFSFPETLIYNGSGEFADFLHDAAAVPTFLVAPRRLATNGTTRVVVADAGSSNLTVINADTQTLQNVSLGAGVTINDVEVVGNFAFATTTGVTNLHRVDLTDLTLTSTAIAGAAQGLGASSDGAALFIGAGAGSGLIQRIDLTVAFPSAPAALPAFAIPGDFPFAFFSSVRNAAAPPPAGPPAGPEPDPPFISQSNTTSTTNGSDNCGLLGLELLLVLACLRARRA